jgi:hypothetical protein
MAEDLKALYGLSNIPELKDDGSNWWDFYRRLRECLGMNGYSDIIDESKEPGPRPEQPVLPNNPSPQDTADYNILQAAYLVDVKAYDKHLAIWLEKSHRVYMAIQSKCAYNNIQKIKEMKRAWQMVDKLRAGHEMGSGRLIELTTCFYRLHLADYESISDFSGQLLKVNHGLYDLHPKTAFSKTQLVLRFL